MGYGSANVPVGRMPRVFQTHEARESGLLLFGVLPSSLAELRRRSSGIEDIIHYLKGQSDLSPILSYGRQLHVIGARCQCPHYAGCRNEGTRLGRVEFYQLFSGNVLSLSLEVEYLTAHHATGPGGSEQFRRYGACRCQIQAQAFSPRRQDSGRERHHAETGLGRSRNIKLPVRGGAATSQVVIVHTRKIVVYQGIGVHDFHRGGQLGRVAATPECTINSYHERRSQALTGRRERIADGLSDWPIDLTPHTLTPSIQHQVYRMPGLGQECAGIRDRRRRCRVCRRIPPIRVEP
jgi:hypothetical protein